jgi:hypothetical protein
MRGWDHWAEILERQYTRTSGQEPKLKQWWTKATEYRSGGFDRILEPAPFSPTRQQLVDQGVKGRAVLQEIATVKPGRAERYLDAVATRWRPIAQQHGLTLIGAYRTAMRDTEAILLWNVPDFAVLTRQFATFARDRAVRRWMGTHTRGASITARRSWCESVWCVTHPDCGTAGAAGRGRRRAR